MIPRSARCGVGAVWAAITIACGPAGERALDGSVGSPEPAATAGPVSRLPAVTSGVWGWLSPDPDNPRYLRIAGEAGARPFAIASYGTLMPCSFDGSQVARLKRQGATYAVVWHQWSGCEVETPDWSQAPWIGPWLLACDPRDPRQRPKCPEHPRWDLSRFDEAYWQQLAAVVAAADDPTDGTGRRLVVRIHLFARQEFDAGSGDNPFRGGNNVNDVRSYDGDPSRDPSLRFFVRATQICATSCEEPARGLFAHQQAYVRRLLDATRRYGNVVYEVMNEPPVAENPDGENARAFAYFTDYWSWFVKEHLARQYGVARLVSQDERNDAFGAANVDIADARWGDHDPGIPEPVFLGDVLGGITSLLRHRSLAYRKATSLDEYGNSEVDPARLRKAAWAIVTSGGHFHLEDPCNPEFRTCTNPPDLEGAAPDPSLDARPWLPVRSIAAFKAASGWQFQRARPAYRDDRASARWFYWMLQGDPAFDTIGFERALAQDHVGYLAHRPDEACTSQPLESELPAVPDGADAYVARLWDPSGEDYLRDSSGSVLERRFAWGGGVFDWCQTAFRPVILRSDDLVFHVHAERPATAARSRPSP